MLRHVPNILTGLRLLLAPAIAWAAWRYWSALGADAGSRADWAYWGAGLFVAAALTDLFDGWAARAFNAESRLGRILDPIADKALVGLPLIVLSLAALNAGWSAFPAIALCTLIIVGRDTGITLLRLASPDGEGVRVSPLAKWKTAVELIAVGAALVYPALREQISPGEASLPPDPLHILVWLAFLGVAAALSAWTGAAYLKPVFGARK